MHSKKKKTGGNSAKIHTHTKRGKRDKDRVRNIVQRADGSIEFTFECTSAGARTANKNKNNGTH